MTQKEFMELSESEVKSINGYESLDYVTEAWRGGYEFARQHILKLFQEKHHDEFLTEVEEFASQELEIFDFDADS